MAGATLGNREIKKTLDVLVEESIFFLTILQNLYLSATKTALRARQALSLPCQRQGHKVVRSSSCLGDFVANNAVYIL